jgi:ParB family transcriptional regulator, chromosome partitioning protein
VAQKKKASSSRGSPLRFMKGELPGYEDLVATMTRRAQTVIVDQIKPADLARSGGSPDEE